MDSSKWSRTTTWDDFIHCGSLNVNKTPFGWGKVNNLSKDPKIPGCLEVGCTESFVDGTEFQSKLRHKCHFDWNLCRAISFGAFHCTTVCFVDFWQSIVSACTEMRRAFDWSARRGEQSNSDRNVGEVHMSDMRGMEKSRRTGYRSAKHFVCR